ncbi:aromatic alcohol reductase [Pedobacter cryophilus]|uniref:NAD-dependent epimerase/dehydratase family protein n=1 Tax=Pedobacter cryophilus TaxID=2571271 RepID=A0A4U1C5Z6_9SPHI|nr:aromatic alcohol reductase [Pedobacter cryophilus]TKC00863.1 NAD-dependent epimerase/dehydratase family protein [Pedobacter cryophilus]
MKKVILVAGGTGNLGLRIVKALIANNAEVRVLARPNSDAQKVLLLEKLGAKVFKLDMNNVAEVTKACEGVSCVVSALAGLRETIIDTQKVLLDAAIKAGVKRFIPSDFSLDFTNLVEGKNRNLDLRREFYQYLDQTNIEATTIFNGPFADLLTDQMPMILFKFHKVLYWGNANQKMDFTTMDDTAAFTAKVAVDETSPRYLRIAGDQLNVKEIATIMTQISGKKHGLIKAGSVGFLNMMIKIGKTFAPAENDLYPAWQGMQYMRDMVEGRVDIAQHDNNRYPEIKWTSVKDVLSAHLSRI